jgi:three-Cys-motif partner protein
LPKKEEALTMVSKLDLHRKKAENCVRCGNSKERKAHQDADGYCQLVDSSDHVGVRCVGEWGADKVAFISTYMDITGVALQYKFRNYYYIEICSGPGLCVDYKSGEEFIGTALASMLTEGAMYYTKLFFFDLNPVTVKSLRQRIDTSPDIPDEVKRKTIVSVGDYTDTASIMKVLGYHIPSHKRGLNVVVVDPTDMSVPFEIYAAMIDFGKEADFIINFADGTDLRRNIKIAFENLGSPGYRKYRRVLESLDFFNDPKNIEHAQNNDYRYLADNFEKIFIQSFRNRGYQYVLEKRIMSYYKLLFFSKDKLGEKFWRDALKRSAAERENCQPVLF